nr:coat protein [Olea europaea geminivirus]
MDSSSKKRKWSGGPFRTAGYRKTRRVLQFNRTQRSQLPVQWSRSLRYNRRLGVFTPPMQYKTEFVRVNNIVDVGSIVCINDCPTGTSVDTRHTQKVRWNRIVLNDSVKLTSEANVHNMKQWLWMWLVYDRRPGNSNPRVNEIFIGESRDPDTWMINMDNVDRFSVVCEKRYVLEGRGYVDSSMDADDDVKNAYFCYMRSRPISVRKKLSGLTVFKDTTGGSVEDMMKGAYYLVFATFHQYAMEVALNVRMWFRSV